MFHVKVECYFLSRWSLLLLVIASLNYSSQEWSGVLKIPPMAFTALITNQSCRCRLVNEQVFMFRLREYTRSESEKSFDECQIRRARLKSLGLAYLSPQNKSLAQSFRYMRNKPTIIAFKTPSMEHCEAKSVSSPVQTEGMSYLNLRKRSSFTCRFRLSQVFGALSIS